MENNENRPVKKSGMAWLWWILAIIFVGIIILCICRSDNGTDQLKEAAAADTTAVAKVANAVEAAADTLAIDTNAVK